MNTPPENPDNANDAAARAAGVPYAAGEGEICVVGIEPAPSYKAENAVAGDDGAPRNVGVVGWGLCVINAVFLLLWAGRLFNPDFLEGPLVPCVALSLLPGTVCALVFRSRFCFTLYRVCFALALIIYLVEKKTLDPAKIWETLTNWQYVVSGILVFCTVILTCAWRWQLLLRGQDIHIGFRALCRLLTASYFFTTFIPGANGGDFFRLFTLAKKDQLPTAAVTTSVVLDHFLGMPALLLFVIVGVVLNLGGGGEGADWQNYQNMVRGIGIAAGLGFIGFWAMLLGSLYLHGWVLRVEKRLPGGRALAKVTGALAAYRERPGLIFAGGGISLLMQLATLLAFILFGRATGIEGIGVSQYLFLVFVGLAANYLPVAPGGVGMGELGFETVFQMAPPFLASNGAHAATMMVCYRLGMLLLGAVGGVIYVLGRHEVRDGEIKEPACANS